MLKKSALTAMKKQTEAAIFMGLEGCKNVWRAGNL